MYLQAASNRYDYRMRIVSLLFLCISLALANVSYAHNFDTSCPMEQQGTSFVVEHGNMKDCCNDIELTATMGKTCKSEQSCSFSISPLVILSSVPSWNLVSSQRSSVLAFFDLVSDPSPTELWRPPTVS